MKKNYILFILLITTALSAQWYNLQWPPSATITEGNSVNVYAQIWISGVTDSPGQGSGVSSWIGVSATNSDPSTWPDSVWIEATFLGDVGNNDEYTAAIGSTLPGGTYYYASRFSYSPTKIKSSDVSAPTYWYGGTGGPWNNDSGVLTVNALPTIGWANLQWPPNASILKGGSADVYAQVYINGVTDIGSPGPGVQAWIGVNSSNSDPATWPESAWTIATFNVDVGNNDEYMASIGNGLSDGTYYYASRFLYEMPTTVKNKNKITDGPDYYYGGYNGGEWDGTTNISGVLTVSSIPDTVIDWADLHSPAETIIDAGDNTIISAHVYENGVTNAPGQGPNINAWIGINSENTNPATWDESAWHTAFYTSDKRTIDEYTLEIGSNLAPGIYYYASRFQVNDGEYYFGGYHLGGGNKWDGIESVSGVLTIIGDFNPVVDWCNLQWPPEGVIDEGAEYVVYAQVWEDGITSTEGATQGLSAWIGISDENTNPNTWSEDAWKTANFNVDVGNNDEFMLDIGPFLTQGTYYYASRFQLEDGPYTYGGHNEGGGGFWDGSTNVSGIVVVDPILSVDDEEIPTVYALDQNYPNPFNPSTKIRFSIPSQSSVKLKIYNIMGEEVAILENGIMQTGIHEINWNASNLSSGVYLLRIEAVSTDQSKEFIDMKKMILMK